CITTIARGQGRSRPLEAVVREVQMMVAGGYQEIVLTGVHLGSYGHDFGNQNGLRDLVKALLEATDIPRIRLSSLEPWDLSDDFFQLWENPRLCRHLHLPLQSGCDATLKRMRRNTKQQAFRKLVESARAQIPGLGLSTDLIVGFPGEDEDEFAESFAFTEAMNFMKIHVFPYSRREGTPAARMKGHVDKVTAKNRLRQIQELSDDGGRRFAQQYIGQTLPVLWEQIRGASEEGFWHAGLTDNYIRVELKYPDNLTNTIILTRLIALSENSVTGELSEKRNQM
ncbi:MAG TPA: MiaB/RimO family radical SAM methylthiotransferase, partial [Aggregatilineales bacterium]|nr:MiaB/RimO family radical SAM methylthiotransferase [Aggregatilineales bacterium]